MFRTSVGTLDYAATQMQSQVRGLKQSIQEMENIAKELQLLSGMEAVSRSIKASISEVETEQSKLLQMMEVLREGAECYSICERGIMDHAEGMRKTVNEDFGWYQLGDYKGIIQELIVF